MATCPTMRIVGPPGEVTINTSDWPRYEKTGGYTILSHIDAEGVETPVEPALALANETEPETEPHNPDTDPVDNGNDDDDDDDIIINED